MRYWGDGNKRTVTCGVNLIQRDGEFTICGNNRIEGGIADGDDWDIIGGGFYGTLKKVTCPNCIKIINYIKTLI
jgi:hypothetical protein